MIELDEIPLAANRSGSAKRIRAGRKRLMGGPLRTKQPLWKRQLRSRKRAKKVGG